MVRTSCRKSFTNVEIYQWIDNKLRVELRLRSKKLKALNLEYASQLTPTVLWKLSLP
ncbi:phage/plasmid replication protein [Pseudomonas aeruginosa]|uniref:phage/plasmid replication domain-containing protein n=1 Tax=Pseudomonas aeruginosa TaxID=287 RepID=UPI00391F6677